MKICGLCGKKRVLQISHLIPKFVFNWIKKTSATGYLRQAINPNLRRQDGIKEKFFCKECEQKFSKYEGYFASNFFHPYLDNRQTKFKYNQNLKKFIISISWRLLKKSLKNLKKHQPEMYKFAKEAEEYWRYILLEDKLDRKYEHHLFLLDYLSKGPKDLPNNFQPYIMRGIDCTIASSKKEIFLYSKFPSMFFISSIYPKKMIHLENSLICESGIIGHKPQICKHPGFGDFLFSRVNYFKQDALSKKQIDIILNTMLKDLDRVKKSKSFELWLEEEKRKFLN